MFKRKLRALNFHNVEAFNVNDTQQFRTTVVWLEDQKIRHYKINDREKLRNVDSKDWHRAFQKYLKDLACPVPPNNTNEVMEWLLGYSVRLEYGDNVEKLKNHSAKVVQQTITNAPKVVSQNPLDNLDFESTEFKDGVNQLADLLKISRHPDHLVTLQAVCYLIKERLSSDAINNPNDVIVEGKAFPIKESDLGFDTGDYILNEAAKILRLLYIQDLRELQSKINECIVGVQNLIANPKTDTKIGQVGR